MMRDTIHYDKNGKNIGRSSEDNDSFISLVFWGGIVGVITVIGWAFEKINQWNTLEMPYNYVAAFYYYTLVIPVEYGGVIISWINNLELTKYPNLNIVITITSAILLLICIILLFRFIIDHSFYNYSNWYLVFLIITPALLGGIWFITIRLFSWLTALA